MIKRKVEHFPERNKRGAIQKKWKIIARVGRADLDLEQSFLGCLDVVQVQAPCVGSAVTKYLDYLEARDIVCRSVRTILEVESKDCGAPEDGGAAW